MTNGPSSSVVQFHKSHPCAYCGRNDIRRTKGHVLSRNIYPDGIPQAKRVTVAECDSCKKLWEDAEPHFRNILLSIWDSDALPSDSRVESMWRGFGKPGGRRQASELFALFQEADKAAPGRQAIYPAKDQRFNLILRRIVRGLAVAHGLATAIPDKAVTCGAMVWEIPPAFAQEFQWHAIAPDFFSYAYATELEPPLNSFWLLRFSKNRLFFGIVEAPPQAAQVVSDSAPGPVNRWDSR